jgi:hypothetical protein
MKLNFLALGLCAALIACGGGTTSNNNDASNNTHDLSGVTQDLSAASTNIHLDSGTFADADIQCATPSDCPGAACCITVTGGSFGSSMCEATASCVPAISMTTLSGQTRACTTDTDCAGSTMLPTCCTATLSGQTGKICFNTTYAQLASLVGATITCP